MCDRIGHILMQAAWFVQFRQHPKIRAGIEIYKITFNPKGMLYNTKLREICFYVGKF